MKILCLILLFSSQVFAGPTRSVKADEIKTADETLTFTLPATSDTLTGRNTTDTLTNKSISGSSNTLTNIDLTSSVTGTLPIANGGTGETTSQAAIDALVPDQTGNAGNFLSTDGTNVSWQSVPAPSFQQSSTTTFTARTVISGWEEYESLSLSDGTYNLYGSITHNLNSTISPDPTGIGITTVSGAGNPGDHAKDKIFYTSNAGTSGDFFSFMFVKPNVVVTGGPVTYFLKGYVQNSGTTVDRVSTFTAERVSD